jgi:anti-sigma regulatory factor (Ser/Thr protein kinase)
MLPPAMLFLLYSHWGNVQRAYQPDAVFQLLWAPAFALLGAAFIHLSLTYRPEAFSAHRKPSLRIDSLPYLPLIALVAYDVSSYLIRGSVPTRLQFIMALGYAVLGGVLSLIIGVGSLLRISRLLPGTSIPANVRRRLGDLLTLWIGGVGLGFCLGILPILLTGKPLLPLEIFYVLATVYPLILWYAIRSLRLIERLEMTLAQREEALRVQQKTEAELRRANMELQRATSLLLHADAHLRSLLSQRIHDQPKQQALRIRSLLGHWQHKLKVEAEREPYARHLLQPVIEALGKVRKISEELEGDLRGLQLLVEDAYQRRSLGLKLHLEKLIREDLPALHPESLLKVQPDLWALDELSQDLEQTAEGEKVAEAISYTVTQALLNVYNHAGASYATVRTARSNDFLEVYIIDDGRGFETSAVSPEKTSLFKAQLKAREAGGTLTIRSITRPQAQHGTTVILRLPFPETERPKDSGPLPHSMVQEF